MTIQVLLFGAFREAAQTGELALEFESSPNVAGAFDEVARQFPSLAPFRRSALFAVNEEHVREGHELHDGDTLAVFPPVSGGADSRDIFEITREPIDKPGLERRISGVAAGAIVTFDGVVREETRGRAVRLLQYEAYVPMALKEMRRIGDDVHSRWPDVLHVGIVHRFGELEVSESSVVIVVSSPHRATAFEACRFAIDQLKLTVPIWKKEVFTDGEEWVEGERSAECGAEQG